MATKLKRIENSLKKQLELKGANVYHFEQLINDYCTLFSIKEKLKADIEDRGITITSFNSKGYEVQKPNPSITEITKISTQMIKILQLLQVSPDENISEDDDEL